MTDERWNAIKKGDLIKRGHDEEIMEVLNVKQNKKKPNALDLKQVARPPAYTATEPKAYEVVE